MTPIEHIDYENPERAIILTISDKALEAYLVANQLDIGAVSDTVLESIKARAFTAIPSHINSLQGSSVVVASSVLTSGAAFMSDVKIEGMAYIVLQYKDNAGIFVILKEAEDDIVTASASYVYMDDDVIMKIEENRLAEYFKRESGYKRNKCAGNKVMRRLHEALVYHKPRRRREPGTRRRT